MRNLFWSSCLSRVPRPVFLYGLDLWVPAWSFLSFLYCRERNFLIASPHRFSSIFTLLYLLGYVQWLWLWNSTSAASLANHSRTQNLQYRHPAFLLGFLVQKWVTGSWCSEWPLIVTGIILPFSCVLLCCTLFRYHSWFRRAHHSCL